MLLIEQFFTADYHDFVYLKYVITVVVIEIYSW